MAIVDKNQVEEFKKILTDKSDVAVKEAAARRKIDTMTLIFEMAQAKFRSGGYTDKEYNDCIDGIGELMGFDYKHFKE